MPKPAKRIRFTAKQKREILGQIREVTDKHYVAPDNSLEVKPEDFQPEGRFGTPRHVGMRYYVDIPEGLRWRDENDDED